MCSQRLTLSFTFNPERYLGDDLSCGESAKLANVMDRDHWTFGAGWVISIGTNSSRADKIYPKLVAESALDFLLQNVSYGWQSRAYCGHTPSTHSQMSQFPLKNMMENLDALPCHIG